MAGLIQNALNTTVQPPKTLATGLPIDQASTTTFTPPKLADPTKWTTSPDQTVAGQIQNLTDPNSPLIQQARTRALQGANQRGLLNSSMAQTAADSAAYDVALPIAQADASTASKIAGYNVDMGNQFAVKDHDTNTQVGLSNMNASNQGSQFNTTQTNVAREQAEKFGFDKQLVEIQRASNREIAGIEAQYKNLTQASASAASILNNLSGNVARIMENTSLDAAAKQKAIDIYSENATKSLQLIGALSGDLELGAFLDEVLGTVGTPPPPTTLPPPVTPTLPPNTPVAPTNPYNPTPYTPGGGDGNWGNN